MRSDLPKCRWCNKPGRPSDFEQETLGTREWARLCLRCANKRLRNPWSALLPMRKVQADAE